MARCFLLFLLALSYIHGLSAKKLDLTTNEIRLDKGFPTIDEEIREKKLAESNAVIREFTEKSVHSMYKIGQYRHFELEEIALTPTKLDPIIYDEEIVTTGLDIPLGDVKFHIANAKGMYDKVIKEGLISNFLNLEESFDLPIVIGKKVGDEVPYGIIISEINFTPTYAELDAYMVLTIPNKDKKLVFMGKGIKISKSGGIIGPAKLYLLEDYPFNLGPETLVKLFSGEDKTYVDFDCEGFKSLSIDAEIEFSKDLFIPENPDGTPNLNDRVKGRFATTINDWNDLIASVSLDPFQVKGLDGVGFYVKDAVFDFSDYNNPPGIVFPEDYQSTSFLPGNNNLWQGFFLKEVHIKLPPQFNEDNQSTRTEFIAENLLIDNMGFSGAFRARNLLSLEKGRMGSWAFSLDSIGFKLNANTLVEGGLKGNMLVPILDPDNPLNYTAFIQPGNNYHFAVQTTSDLKVNAWVADLELYESSLIEVRVENGKFKPRAELNGKLDINADFSGQRETGSNGKGIKLADLRFEGLKISAEDGISSPGTFSFGMEGAQQKMANFPVSIKEVGLKDAGSGEIGLDFRLVLNLTEEGEGGFGAEAGLTIISKFDKEKGLSSYSYRRTIVNDIVVDIDQTAFKLYGQLKFFKDDHIYGSGFKGQVNAEFMPNIKVKATALFGQIADYRYWYADAMASFNSGITIVPGFGIYGFGGGAYNRMKQDGYAASQQSIGASSSGVVYIPSKTSGLGIKASVDVGTQPSPKAFNGDATFEISFNQKGGINSVGFKGNGYFMSDDLGFDTEKLNAKVSKLSEGGTIDKKDAAISASLDIKYDVPNKTLHANLKTYVSVAGGVLRGAGANNLAGEAVLHFSPGTWYVYIGTPDERVGLKMGVGALSVNTGAYFMVGSEILGSPPPPHNVAKIMPNLDLDYMRDLNALGNGAGFAMGANLGFSTGKLTALIFYAQFEAGIGFDLMIKDYGDASCVGRPGPIGINGWYANGQAYAYLNGAVGLEVKLRFYKGSFEIFKVGGAALLQAKLPNPFWMRGAVAGNYSILNGLVKGRCEFDLVIGEDCKVQPKGSVLEGTQILADMTPMAGEKEVDVFSSPQAVFNMPVGKVFELRDHDGSLKAFRVKLEYFKLLEENREIKAAFEWNENNDVLALRPFEVLPGKKELNLKVKISFEERKSNNTWVQVKIDGVTHEEHQEIKFFTGDTPDYLPDHLVDYSYPIKNQVNFYKEESNKGFIKLNRKFPELFNPGPEWVQVARISSVSGQKFDFTYSYDVSGSKVTFDVPSDLSLSQIYHFELVNVPKTYLSSIDENVKDVTHQMASTETYSVEIRTKEAEGKLEDLKEKSIYSMYFRSSKYASLHDKMKDVIIDNQYNGLIRDRVTRLIAGGISFEDFDQAELEGNEYYEPLVSVEAVLDDNDWFQNKINPILYRDYPLLGRVFITYRNPKEKGVPPVKGVNILSHYVPLLSTDNISSGEVGFPLHRTVFEYNLSHFCNNDFGYMRTDVASILVDGGNPNDNIKALLSTPYPNLTDGLYKIKVLYTVPDGQPKLVGTFDMIKN